jgi:hypothetical protein
MAPDDRQGKLDEGFSTARPSNIDTVRRIALTSVTSTKQAVIFCASLLVFSGLCGGPSLWAQEGESRGPLNWDPGTFLSPYHVSDDLDQFQRELEGRFAYLKANDNDVNYLRAIRSVREKGLNGMTVHELGIELKKVIALFIDCHSHIGQYGPPEGDLPFQIVSIGDRYIAFWPDRRDFLEPLHPYLVRIDGKSIEEWHQIVRTMFAKGSPSYVKHYTARYLEAIQFARQIAGLEAREMVDVELESKDRSTRVSLSLPVSYPGTAPKKWPDSQSHVMEGNIAYLRITGWNANAYTEVASWMPRFAGTRGLIIDIRHNPGGTRNVLRDLYPYLVSESHPPRVAGAAKYRLWSEFGPDHLDGRNMHSQDWHGWTAAERASISEFMESFEPEWVVPEEEFSDWHFWVLSKASNPQTYYYDRPIVFLMDYRNFSASDVILASVKGMDNVTLIGEPSGGASGAYVETTLTNSELTLSLSSMASFQPTGRLFDGVGVEPDIFAEPEPEYYLLNGRDTVLEFVVEYITRESSSR